MPRCSPSTTCRCASPGSHILQGVTFDVPPTGVTVAAGPQRRRQDHHAAGDPRPDAAPAAGRRRGRFDGRAGRWAGRPTAWSAAGSGTCPRTACVFAGLTVAENLRLAERAGRARLRHGVRALPRAVQRGRGSGPARCPAASSRCSRSARVLLNRQPAAARRRADQGPGPEGGDRGGRRARTGSPGRCRCCWSSRTWPWSGGSAATRSCWPPGGSPGPAPLAELLGDAELTRSLLGVGQRQPRDGGACR